MAKKEPMTQESFKYYVIEDEDGFFLMDKSPPEGVIVHLRTNSLFEAECRLCRECQSED